jgi:hypothetical protein
VRAHTVIFSNNRELPLLLYESPVKGLVRPVYQDDRRSSSQDGIVVSGVPCRGLTPHPGPSPNRESLLSRTKPITQSGKEP